ncbi:MAG: tRNA lysidine(34) synthetase TilS [Candidatus Rokubacteria bacterium]|nr:tRNA lysidine(34) synthetase TilS [Candidatus Rokubacteria bacterium]
MNVLDRVRDTIRRHAMLAGGERVLVAVSGGADSVALLHALQALAPELRLRLHVLHVDHRLRPDSGRDAAFVTALGARLGVETAVAAVDVAAAGSPEEAARHARYAALEAHAARIGATRIAVGHTADDQAETVLMRLLEGTGPRGLAGIPPVRGRIVRPLIELRRADVVETLRAAGETWIEDPSNEDRRFVRNRIRHDVLPALARATPDVVAALCRTARLARETVDALERAAAIELERVAVAGADEITLPLGRLRELPRPLAAEVLRQAAARLGGGAPLRAWAHRGLRRIVADPPPRRPFRLGRVRIDVGSGRVRLGSAAPAAVAARALVVPGTTALPEVEQALAARVVDAGGYVVPRDTARVAFDADRLEGPLAVRARRRGDRFAPFGSPERRLKEFLIHAKVPRWRRDALPLVTVADDIVWVAGVRRGAAAPVTPATRRIVELTLLPLASPPPDR